MTRLDEIKARVAAATPHMVRSIDADDASFALLARAASDLAWLIAEVERLQSPGYSRTKEISALRRKSGALMDENAKLRSDLDAACTAMTSTLGLCGEDLRALILEAKSTVLATLARLGRGGG